MYKGDETLNSTVHNIRNIQDSTITTMFLSMGLNRRHRNKIPLINTFQIIVRRMINIIYLSACPSRLGGCLPEENSNV